jgi:hypothetical protein
MSLSIRTAIKRGLVAEQWRDDDGYWIAMKAGWQVVGDPTCHQIHENTKREALRHRIEWCYCNNCTEGGPND